MAKEAKKKIAEREALNAAGESQTDYTEAVTARYTFLDPKHSISMSFAHLEKGIDRAFAIEGFLNKAGHAANKARNGEAGDAGVPEELDAFLANALDGGWTNREGGYEVNLGAIQEAWAKLNNKPLERVKEVWVTMDDDAKSRVRANPHIKALVAEAKAAKLRSAAGGEAGPDLPAIPD